MISWPRGHLAFRGEDEWQNHYRNGSQEELIGDCLFVPLWLLLLVLLLPFPVEGRVLPRAIELLDFAVALPR